MIKLNKTESILNGYTVKQISIYKNNLLTKIYTVVTNEKYNIKDLKVVTF